jgi:hypothetical protein
LATPPPRAPFRDIRNQRDTVAEEKAELCAVLNRLLRSVPASIRGASINKTRAYMAERERCLKVLKSPRSSRVELQSAINTMRQYETEGA